MRERERVGLVAPGPPGPACSLSKTPFVFLKRGRGRKDCCGFVPTLEWVNIGLEVGKGVGLRGRPEGL